MSTWRKVLSSVQFHYEERYAPPRMSEEDERRFHWMPIRFYFSHAIVASEAGTDVGYIGWSEFGDKKPARISVLMTYLLPEYRKMGLGQKLQDAFVNHLNETFGPDGYTINTNASTDEGEKTIDYRRKLLPNPEVQNVEHNRSMVHAGWRKVLAWETAQTVDELQPGDDCWLVPSRSIMMTDGMAPADKMEYWDDSSNWEPAKFIKWVSENDARVRVTGGDKTVHRYWLRTQGTPTGQSAQHSLGSLRWETTDETAPVAPIAYNQWRQMSYSDRATYVKKLMGEIDALKEADDPSVKEWRGQWNGYVWATAIIYARNHDEAKILAKDGQYENWDENVSEDFEFDDVEEL
jgi:GNAT superfamily N-acetyltransferase